jgi:hypothetical protein
MVTSYYGTIVKKVGESGSSIFEKDHQFATYYLAGLAFYRLDSIFNSGVINTKYKKIKFFILMLVTKLATEEKIQHLNSKRLVDKFCDPIIAILNDQTKTEKLFKKVVKIIDESGVDINDKQFVKSKSMTDGILNKWKENAA